MRNKNISFKVSEVFGHRVPGLVLQDMGEDYRYLIFTPNQHMVLTIPKSMPKLVDYKLSKNMNDYVIQKETNSTPMDEKTFFLVKYCLIIEPERGKELLGYELKKDGTWYLLQINLADGSKRCVKLYFSGFGWQYDTDFFGSDEWEIDTKDKDSNIVFLYNV